MRRHDLLERDAGAGAGTAALRAAPPAKGHTVRGWNLLALQAIRAARLPAPLAVRTLAVLHTAMYNAWAAYDDAARQTVHGVAVRLPCGERQADGRIAAMGHAAHFTLCSRFPAQRAVFDAHLAHLLRGLPRAARQPDAGGTLAPAGIGRVQAASVLDACGQDGAVPPLAAAGLEAVCEGWCLVAREVSERDADGDDRDVLLFFALANTLDNAVIALQRPERRTVRPLTMEDLPAAPAGMAWRAACDEAAAEVLARFAAAGDTAGKPAGEPACGTTWGRTLGALSFEKARHHWQGSL